MDEIGTFNYKSLTFSLEGPLCQQDKELRQIVKWNNHARDIYACFQKIGEGKEKAAEIIDLTNRVDVLLQEVVLEANSLMIEEENSQKDSSLYAIYRAAECIYELRKKMLSKILSRVE